MKQPPSSVAAFSIIMPAYNAEAYIARAIASAERQEGVGWQLVIADDASSDGTAAIAREAAMRDPRIIHLRLPANTGSPCMARREAARAASAPYVVELDADDMLADGYLRAMAARIDATGADVVCPSMIWADPDGLPSGPRLPDAEVDTAAVISGARALALTIGRWRIGLNGIAVRRELYLQSYSRMADCTAMCADELLSRIQLSMASSVAFAPEARYLYRQNPGQITRHPSARVLRDVLRTQCGVADLCADVYPSRAAERRMAQAALARCIIYTASELARTPGADCAPVAEALRHLRLAEAAAAFPGAMRLAVGPRALMGAMRLKHKLRPPKP